MDGASSHNPRSLRNHGDGANAAHERLSWRQRLEERIWGRAEAPTQGPKALLLRWLQILDRSINGFLCNKGLESASALTFTSIMTIVPLLAILFSVLKGFNMHEKAREAMLRLPVVQELRVDVGERNVKLAPTGEVTPPPQAPAAAQSAAQPVPPVLTGADIVNKLYEFVEKTETGNLGLIGLFGLLWAVFALLSRIELAMNEAWSVRRARPWGRRLSDYMNMLVISVLLLAALSTTATGSIIPYAGIFAESFNAVQRRLLKLVPYLIVWVAFTLLYLLMPNTRVRWRSALVSGLLAGTLFQAAQVFFIRGQIFAGRYKIYGVFVIAIILLVWLYVSWCIVLWGAEVCSAHQNLRDWRRRRRKWEGSPAEQETLALRLAALLAAPLLTLTDDQRRLDVGDLADMLRLPPGPVGEMLEKFQAHGLAVQSADDGTYLFARAPESVSVLDLLRLVRQGRLEPQPPGGPGLLSQLSEQLAQPLAQRTVRELVDMPVEEIRTFAF